jgi:hypothetical protein
MKSLLFVFALLSISQSAISQEEWVDDGAIWHYNFWNVGTKGYYEYMYTHDTLIDGHMCQVIEGERHAFFNVPELEYLGVTDLETQYIYMNGDTVFYRDHDEFFVMLNFNAGIGETWVISTTIDVDEVCDDTSRVEVLAIEEILIHDVLYKKITIEPTSTSSRGFAGTFVKRFGNISAGLDPFLWPFPMGYECDAMSEHGVYEWDFVGFSCFQDNSFPLYQPYTDYCDYYLEVESNTLPQMKVYPNPANETITVENVQINSAFAVFDMTGKRVCGGVLENEKIDLQGLDNGLYVLQVGDSKTSFVVAR